MKAISLRPPWPYAIFHLDKDIENRTWPTRYRGPLLIHASKTWDEAGYDFLSYSMDRFVPSKQHHVFGAIVGQVNLINCVDRSDSRWFFGDYGFELEDPIEFKKPFTYKGQLGIFDVPDHVLRIKEVVGVN
jgi:hypothetical protein